MSRGRTAKGRSRARRARPTLVPPRALLATEDHGRSVHVEAGHVGASGDRWIEPFLEANRQNLARLDVTASVDTAGGLRARLTPGGRLGAVPLLSPATRRVAAGLLVRPRFRWSALGSVMSAVGFATEPRLGQAPLVPGSAREVPTWLIAGPVLRRLEGLLGHRRRQFVEREEHRASPRGRVDWSRWATRDLPSGRWTQLPCRFPEPADDPRLLANVRWTLRRLELSLAPHRTTAVGRALHERVRTLQVAVGPGALQRPDAREPNTPSAWILEALEAMGWVREERGLGGSRSLDGLAWDLSAAELWESWVRSFATDLAPHLGLTAVPADQTRRGLHWSTRIGSMASLAPDCILQGHARTVFLDAKYKPHLDQLASRGWPDLSAKLRESHRADLHQALAYANLSDAPVIDTLLVYPTTRRALTPARSTIPAGRKRLRLHLLPLPFGYSTPAARATSIEAARSALSL